MSGGIRSSFRSEPGDESQRPTMEALSAACSERFLPPAYRVSRDDPSGTVWVSLDGCPLAIGLRPNMVERRGLAAVLLDTHARLSAFKPAPPV